VSASDGQDPGDEFNAELSDLRPRVSATSQPLPFRPQRSHQQAVRWAIGLAGVLLVLLVAVNLPGVRDGALAIIVGPTPTPLPAPVATRSPGDDLFYLLPNPPGVTVALDGKALGQLPLPGGGHPVRLAPGRHMLAWTSRLFPLRPLKCQVSVPPAHGDSCPFVTQEFIPNVLANDQGHIIALHESLAALAAPDASALTAAVTAAVASVSSTGFVQPGETFQYFDNNALTGEQVVAQQTLRATLNFQYLSPDPAGYPEPCTLAQPAIPCRFAGQDCTQVCTVDNPPAAVTLRPDQEWIGAVEVHASWTYTLLDGAPDAQDVGEPFGLQLMALRITHNAGGWHVSPIIGHTPGLDVADDPVCDPARYLLSQTSSWSFMVLNPPPYASATFVSGTNLADGCAVALDYGTPTAPAIFLQRFGVLSTANADARNPTDNLPVADTAEQQLAQHLLASAGG
jgi:hypothetical protein